MSGIVRRAFQFLAVLFSAAAVLLGVFVGASCLGDGLRHEAALCFGVALLGLWSVWDDLRRVRVDGVNDGTSAGARRVLEDLRAFAARCRAAEIEPPTIEREP